MSQITSAGTIIPRIMTSTPTHGLSNGLWVSLIASPFGNRLMKNPGHSRPGPGGSPEGLQGAILGTHQELHMSVPGVFLL